MTQQCPSCSQLVEPGAPSCPHCGAPQQQTPEQPAAPGQAQAQPAAPPQVQGQAQPAYPVQEQAQPAAPPQGQPYSPQAQGQPYPVQAQAQPYPVQAQAQPYPYPPQGQPGYPPPGAPMAGYGGGGLGMVDSAIYKMPAPQSMIPPQQASAAMAHQLGSFPTAVVVLLHFLTLGIFTMIYMGLHHGKLPVVAHDDPSAGKAIGFLFIPFYNIYWNFIFWLRLCDRINFQYQMRGMAPSAPRGLALATIIVNMIPYVGFVVGYIIMMPILVGILQSKVNELATLEGR